MRLTLFLLIHMIMVACSHSKPPQTSQLLSVGQQFPQIALKDQFDKDTPLSFNTSWVLFSREKNVNATLHKILLQYPQFQKQGGIYIADISAMPQLVTQFFALPKMREYPYSMSLDTKGATTAQWPSQKGAATLFKLKSGRIETILFLKTDEDFIKLLATPQS